MDRFRNNYVENTVKNRPGPTGNRIDGDDYFGKVRRKLQELVKTGPKISKGAGQIWDLLIPK